MAVFYLVQDFAKGEERLARQDGAYKIFPPDTLLPLMKAEKIKLTKEIDEAGVLREFVFSVDISRDTVLTSSGWPAQIIPPETSNPNNPNT
ncbi:hypothetical protein ACU4GA_31565 [Methylobacterium oryzae CBMB20]